MSNKKYVNTIKIDGKPMPPVKSLKITREPLWSKNTGRCADGEMKGDIIAQKWKLEIVFAPMSDEQAATLDAAILPAFFEVEYRDPGSGKRVTKTMYARSPSYPVYSYVDRYPRYQGVGVNLIWK